MDDDAARGNGGSKPKLATRIGAVTAIVVALTALVAALTNLGEKSSGFVSTFLPDVFRSRRPAGGVEHDGPVVPVQPTQHDGLGGAWIDRQGRRYDIVQTGSGFSFRQTEDGHVRSTGEGTISGGTVTYDWTLRNGTAGSCHGYLTGRGRKVEVSCHVTGEASAWPTSFSRVGG